MLYLGDISLKSPHVRGLVLSLCTPKTKAKLMSLTSDSRFYESNIISTSHLNSLGCMTVPLALAVQTPADVGVQYLSKCSKSTFVGEMKDLMIPVQTSNVLLKSF